MESSLANTNPFDTLAALTGGDAQAWPARDLVIVAKYMLPTDAYLARGCLVAAGIPAVVADANHVQANSLITIALGGVRVMVPEEFLAPAQETLNAKARGEFELSEDADVGPLTD